MRLNHAPVLDAEDINVTVFSPEWIKLSRSCNHAIETLRPRPADRETFAMSGSVKILAAIMLLAAALASSATTPASARGAAPNIMNSPGYQRALEESRKRQAEPYLKKPAVYPRKTWRKRGRRD